MKNKEVIKSDITFSEACEILKKSKRTVSRYIKKGLLNPEKVKSQKGMILLNQFVILEDNPYPIL